MSLDDFRLRHFRPAVTRRDVLVRAAHGFGAIALESLLARRPRRRAARQSARRQAAALRAQGEIGDLPVHGGRAQPHRHVRSQAGARKIRRPAAAAQLRHSGQPVHQGRHAAAEESLEIQEVRPVRPRGLDAVSAHRRSTWTICASCARSTPRARCTRRPCTR